MVLRTNSYGFFLDILKKWDKKDDPTKMSLLEVIFYLVSTQNFPKN